jgi:hypothetical protein
MTEATIKLKATVISQIRESQRLKNRLMFELNMSSPTLYRMLKDNSDDFTKANTLRIISEELNIDKEELLTN